MNQILIKKPITLGEIGRKLESCFPDLLFSGSQKPIFGKNR